MGSGLDSRWRGLEMKRIGDKEDSRMLMRLTSQRRSLDYVEAASIFFLKASNRNWMGTSTGHQLLAQGDDSLHFSTPTRSSSLIFPPS